VVILSTTGCTSLQDYVHNGFKVGPDYHCAQAPVATKWIDAADARVRTESADTSRWWTAFHDPVLEALVTNAYSQNLTLKQAGMRIFEARMQLNIAKGELFPQTQDLTGGYSRVALAANPVTGQPQYFMDQWSILNGGSASGFNLAWELDFWGRFRRAVESAEATLEASVDGYDDAMVTLLADVATNYVAIRTSQQRIKVAETAAKRQGELLRMVEARFKAGTATKVDVDQLSTTVLQVEAQIPQFEITIRQAADHLCTLLGTPTYDLLQQIGNGPIPTAPSEVAVGIPANLLERRPDIREAERNAAAQSALIGVAQANLYPHISINGTIGYQSPQLSNLITPSAFQGSVGPSFQWNVLNYGRIVNDVRYQDAKFRELLIAYQNTVLTANEETENGLVTFLRSQHQATILDHSVHDIQEAMDMAIPLYMAGTTDAKGAAVADLNRLVVLETTLVQQQDAAALSRGQIALGLIQIYKALGGGWQLRCENVTPVPINPPPEAIPLPSPPG
jgi:NodT family efflux transporter outer membrane factor (OMF) lipoprotein